MKGYIYLVKKKGIHSIGHCKDLNLMRKKINPDEIIQTLFLEDVTSLEARLFRRYKKARMPDSAYFQLSPEQVEDCKKQLGQKSQMPKSIGAEFSICITGSIVLFLLLYFSLNYFNLNFLVRTSYSLVFSSIPFWLLLSLGNFGGYETADLPLFSSWANRTKAFASAAIILLLAYLFFLSSLA